MRNATMALIGFAWGAAALPASAQTTVADAKTVAETEKLKAETDKSRADTQKVLIDALAGAKTGFGETTTTTLENGAEALMLQRMVLQQAVKQLHSDVVAAKGKDQTTPPVLIVIGSQPPGTGEWLSFQQAVKLLKANLENASADWTAAKPKKAGSGSQKFVDPLTITTVITAATTIASLFRTDISLTGTSLSTDDQLLIAMVDAKFNRGTGSSSSGLAMTRSIDTVTSEIANLDTAYRRARTDYRAYLAQVPKDPKETQGMVGQAGAKLAAVIADYDAFVAALYKPVNGISPAMVIEFQSQFVADPDQPAHPILYIRSHKGALTLETRKNLGTGFGTVPTWGRATVTLAYSYVGTTMHSGVVTCISQRKRITQIVETDTRTEAQQQRENKYPAYCKS